MHERVVYVVADRQEMELTFNLTKRLKDHGYEVISDDNVHIGESTVNEATKAISAQVPIVLCATKRAAGSAWVGKITNAARLNERSRILVVQMEPDVNLEMIALRTQVALYHEDSETAIQQVLNSLAEHYKSSQPEPNENNLGKLHNCGSLEDVTSITMFDLDALQQFRSMLRDEYKARYPDSLNPWEFLDRTGLRKDGRLTSIGVLLFGNDTSTLNHSTIVQCREYSGKDTSHERFGGNLEGPLFRQIEGAGRFVAKRGGEFEAPNAGSATSVTRFDYPMIAVREIIANALVHRDYTITNACVHVRMFTDRLEVTSPGTWSGPEDLDDVGRNLDTLSGQSTKRNFRLAQILYWIRLVEGEGSGIPTAVRNCLELQTEVPIVKQEHDHVTVILWRRQRNGTEDGKTQGLTLLPSQPPFFTGRTEQLDALNLVAYETTSASEGTSGLAVISGAAGVGKTALAVYWAYQVRTRFPDGQVYINLEAFSGRDPMSPLNAIRLLLTALGVPSQQVPADLDMAIAVYRRRLQHRHMLILLDNARDVAQVQPLLPTSHGCIAVVTSRNQLTALVAVENARPIPLPLLSPAEARALFVARLGTRLATSDPQSVDLIVDQCGRLPLALVIAAAHAATRLHVPLRMLAVEIGDEQRRLSVLDAGDPSASIRALFANSYRSLHPQAQRLFRLLGLHPGPSMDWYAIANLAGISLKQTRLVATELASAHLLEESDQGRRFFLHDLLRIYAQEQLNIDDDKERTSAIRRLLDYYLHTARTADRLLDSSWETVADNTPTDLIAMRFTNYEDAMDWFKTERATLLATVRYAAEHRFDTHAYQLTWSLTTFLYRHSDWQGWADACEVAAPASRRAGDRNAEARSHRILASAYTRLRRYRDARNHYEKALALFSELNDLTGQAHTQLSLGRLFGWEGNPQTALEYAYRALELYRTIGDRRWEARVLNDIGRECGKLGDRSKALDTCEKALRLCTEVGDQDAEATTLSIMARLCDQIGRVNLAVNYYTRSAALQHGLGNQHDEAKAFIDLAEVLEAAGRGQAAAAAWRQASALLEQLNELDHLDTVDLRLRINGHGNLPQLG